MNLKQITELVNDYATKFVDLVGIRDEVSTGDFSPKDNIQECISRTTLDADSFSNYLPYKYYDEESDIFYDDEDTAGFIFEISPIVGVDESLIKNMHHLFNSELPLGSYVQFLLVAGSDISPITNFWEENRTSNHPSLTQLGLHRKKFLETLSVDYRNSIGKTARNYKIYFIYSRKLSRLKSSFQKIKLEKQTLRQKLDSLGLNPYKVDADGLIKLVREMLELDLSLDLKMPSDSILKNKPKYNPTKIISDQILTKMHMNQVHEDRIEHKTTKLSTKCYFAQNLPEEFSLDEMINLLGDSERDNLSIPARFCISFVVSNNIPNTSQNAIIAKGERVIENSEQWYNRNNRDAIRESQEFKGINDKAKNGEKFLNEYLSICITAPSDFIDEAEQSLISLYNSLNFQLEINRYFQMPALLSMLPMNQIDLWKYLNLFKLTRTVLSGEVIAKLPIHAEWQGVPEAGMLFLGRRGQVFNWNPFYRVSSGNYNVCVFGPSGSGKSVLLQDFATNMMAQGAKIFVLDIGQSFKNICKILGGEIIQFDRNSKIILNPFLGYSNDMEEEDRNTIKAAAKAIICTMCGATNDSLKESIIEKAIARGLDRYGKDLSITKLSEVLLDLSKEGVSTEIASNLSSSLFSYTKEGLYGKFFDNDFIGSSKRKEVTFNKQITVFEFEEIKKDKLLLSVILQIISMQIFMQVLTGDRDKRFVLIVDEAWMILDHSAKFLAELARTIRKYGGSLVTCVQNFNDLHAGDHHRAILENSTWTLLLKQDEKGLNSFKNSDAFKDMLPLIRSISISKKIILRLLYMRLE
jgi:conjugal transfer ATP-binding protein TraC